MVMRNNMKNESLMQIISQIKIFIQTTVTMQMWNYEVGSSDGRKIYMTTV